MSYGLIHIKRQCMIRIPAKDKEPEYCPNEGYVIDQHLHVLCKEHYEEASLQLYEKRLSDDDTQSR